MGMVQNVTVLLCYSDRSNSIDRICSRGGMTSNCLPGGFVMQRYNDV